MNLSGSRMPYTQRVSRVTKRIIHTTYPNLVLIGSVYGINEKIGVEGLEPIVSKSGGLPRR